MSLRIGGMYNIGADQLLMGADRLMMGADDDDDLEALLSGALDDDDDDDVIGAVLRRAVGKKSPKRLKQALMKRAALQAVAAKQVQAGSVLKDYQFSKARSWPLPFDTVTTVAAGATVNITSNPQMPFKPYRLAIGGSIAASFLLNNIIIGQQPQFAALNAAGPADAFAPTAFGVDLDCDTAQPNTNVILQVTNASLAALRFNAFMIGRSVL